MSEPSQYQASFDSPILRATTTRMTEKKHPRSALILYGSETGNAQDVAEELGSMAERLHFVTQLSEMDKVQAVRECNRK